ncbi:MAG: hypothetical protein AB1805_02655 [Nitrospirota bacterium]
MKRKSLGLLYFAITLAALLAVLKLLNWLPSAVQKGMLRHYTTIEEVKSALKIKTVYVPAYFPQNLSWPPSALIAQRSPFIAVIMHFRSRDSRDIGMVIQQISAGAEGYPDTAIVMGTVLHRSPLAIKDREGTLVTGLCDGRIPCYRVSWTEGEYHLSVTLKGQERELIRIARSMIPGASSPEEQSASSLLSLSALSAPE